MVIYLGVHGFQVTVYLQAKYLKNSMS